jgi:hypothetical protein
MNIWFGGFHNICWEMMLVKYDFFLDKMILCWNQMMVAILQTQGKIPHHQPVS